MANLQIKGIDDRLYEEIKKLATEENRSVSQQTLMLIKDYLAKRRAACVPWKRRPRYS